MRNQRRGWAHPSYLDEILIDPGSFSIYSAQPFQGMLLREKRRSESKLVDGMRYVEQVSIAVIRLGHDVKERNRCQCMQ
jgi:hypothetical protein